MNSFRVSGGELRFCVIGTALSHILGNMKDNAGPLRPPELPLHQLEREIHSDSVRPYLRAQREAPSIGLDVVLEGRPNLAECQSRRDESKQIVEVRG
jgi:hypothetical protein